MFCFSLEGYTNQKRSKNKQEKQTNKTQGHAQQDSGYQRAERWGCSKGSRGLNVWWQEIWLRVVGTQCNTPMVCNRIVNLEPTNFINQHHTNKFN